MKMRDIMGAVARPPVNEALERSFPVSYRRGEPCDVYSDPSRKEYLAALESNDEVRAFLHAGRLLVWNTYGALHQTVRDTLGLGPDAIPLVIYGRPSSGAEVLVTDNTRNTPWHHNGGVVDAVMDDPHLHRLFGDDIAVSFYDEDIVGDWREL